MEREIEGRNEGSKRNIFLHPCMRCCISLVLIRGESNDEVLDTDMDLYPISFHFILSVCYSLPTVSTNEASYLLIIENPPSTPILLYINVHIRKQRGINLVSTAT